MTKRPTKEELLQHIDNTSKAIINLGRQLFKITPDLFTFDFLLIATLHRTVNINKAFTQCNRDNNFIAAAPLVRINMDSLLRLYAARISEYSMHEFSERVIKGEHIRNMKSKDNNKQKLTDQFLVQSLSEIEGMKWVEKVYAAGNSFVHLSDSIVFSANSLKNIDKNQIALSIGFHDAFLPDSEKYGAAVWMYKINVAIIEQAQWYMADKAKMYDFDIEKLNDIDKD
jgi:hypothetical protein